MLGIINVNLPACAKLELCKTFLLQRLNWLLIFLRVFIADCVFGDSPGLVLRGKTCTNLLRTEPFQCYSDSIKKNCCVSCEKVKTGIPSKYST